MDPTRNNADEMVDREREPVAQLLGTLPPRLHVRVHPHAREDQVGLERESRSRVRLRSHSSAETGARVLSIRLGVPKEPVHAQANRHGAATPASRALEHRLGARDVALGRDESVEVGHRVLVRRVAPPLPCRARELGVARGPLEASNSRAEVVRAVKRLGAREHLRRAGARPLLRLSVAQLAQQPERLVVQRIDRLVLKVVGDERRARRDVRNTLGIREGREQTVLREPDQGF